MPISLTFSREYSRRFTKPLSLQDTYTSTPISNPCHPQSSSVSIPRPSVHSKTFTAATSPSHASSCHTHPSPLPPPPATHPIPTHAPHTPSAQPYLSYSTPPSLDIIQSILQSLTAHTPHIHYRLAPPSSYIAATAAAARTDHTRSTHANANDPARPKSHAWTNGYRACIVLQLCTG